VLNDKFWIINDVDVIFRLYFCLYHICSNDYWGNVLVKLYNVKKHSFIRVGDTVELFFDHLDGMYSYCIDKVGQTYHIAAFTDVEVIDKPDDWDC
jgi:hypothetical protein